MSGTVGKISYVNTAPFFYDWPEMEFPLVPGVPRELAQMALEGKIVAAALPIVECWKMEDLFAPLGTWGIVAKQKCESVLVFSRRPFSELNNTIIGVTQESSTSIVLCDVLQRCRYNNNIHLRRGFHPTDEAILVIGDEALQLFQAGRQSWPYVTDLAAEWWDWHKLPFVFARWVIKRNDLPLENSLWRVVQSSLSAGRRSLPLIAEQQKEVLRLPPQKILSYLDNFEYEVSRAGQESIGIFRDLAGLPAPELTGASFSL